MRNNVPKHLKNRCEIGLTYQNPTRTDSTSDVESEIYTLILASQRPIILWEVN